MNKCRFLFLALCLAVVPSWGRKGSNLRVTRLTTDFREGLVVTDDSVAELRWQVAGAENGAWLMASDVDVESDGGGQTLCTEKGQTVRLRLAPSDSKRYRWRVRVKDGHNHWTSWSPWQTIVRQTAEGAFGKAQWIGAITRADAHIPQGRHFTHETMKDSANKAAWAAADTLSRRSIRVSRTFSLPEGRIKSALLNWCGLGFCHLEVNGQTPEESDMSPLWSDYDKTVFYNTRDVTDLLRSGDNRLEAVLGNGFYNEQGGRYRKLLISFGPPTLKARLSVQYENGRKVEIITDGKWQYRPGRVTFNSIYGGEDYDAAMTLPAWRPVVIQEGPAGKLRPQTAPPITVWKTCEGRLIGQSGDTLVYDLEQNMAGQPAITVSGKKGQRVIIRPGETLDVAGKVNQRQTGRPHYYIYTLSGDGEETWHPMFSYYGCRYMQVEGAATEGTANPDGLPVIRQLAGRFISNATRTTGRLETSSERVNATHRIIHMAVRSNMQAVLTDCPHREKLGWLEQDYLNSGTLTMNYDMAPYLQGLMRNIADAQKEDGMQPTTAPEYLIFEGKWLDPFRESPEWGGAVVFLPLLYYNTYGSDQLIRQYYPYMKRYADYLARRAEDGIVSFGLGDWYDYNGTRAGFSKNTPVPLVATAHYWRWTRDVARAADILRLADDKGKYDQRADSIREAFNRAFFHADSLYYGTNSQTSNAIPLVLGLADDDCREGVLANLIQDIQRHGDRLTTGDVGNRFLFEALTMNRLDSLLWRMLDHDSLPGYGYQIKQGATTLTEQWDPKQGASQNHFMMGQIDEFFYTRLAGFSSLGGNAWLISPQPVGNLTSVRAETETPYGKVSIAWRRDKGVFSCRLTLPIGTTAQVRLPGSDKVRTARSGVNEWKTKLK